MVKHADNTAKDVRNFYRENPQLLDLPDNSKLYTAFPDVSRAALRTHKLKARKVLRGEVDAP